MFSIADSIFPGVIWPLEGQSTSKSSA